MELWSGDFASERWTTKRIVDACATQACHSFGNNKRHVSVDPLPREKLEPRFYSVHDEVVAIISVCAGSSYGGWMSFVAQSLSVTAPLLVDSYRR